MQVELQLFWGRKMQKAGWICMLDVSFRGKSAVSIPARVLRPLDVYSARNFDSEIYATDWWFDNRNCTDRDAFGAFVQFWEFIFFFFKSNYQR